MVGIGFLLKAASVIFKFVFSCSSARARGFLRLVRRSDHFSCFQRPSVPRLELAMMTFIREKFQIEDLPPKTPRRPHYQIASARELIVGETIGRGNEV
jgi:hypothetical protein